MRLSSECRVFHTFNGEELITKTLYRQEFIKIFILLLLKVDRKKIFLLRNRKQKEECKESRKKKSLKFLFYYRF